MKTSSIKQVAVELGRNEFDPALMAKATGKSLGDKDLAKSLYIELRVIKLKVELAVRLETEKQEQAARLEAEILWRSKEYPRAPHSAGFCLSLGR